MRDIIFTVKYGLLSMFREKQFLFWMIVFPISLMTIYSLAFSGLDNQKMMTIKLGLPENSGLEQILVQIEMFHLVEAESSELERLLAEEEIDAFLDEDLKLIVPDSSLKSNLTVTLINSLKRYTIAYMIKANQTMDIGLSDSEILDLSLKEIADNFKTLRFNPLALAQKASFLNSTRKIEQNNQETSVLLTVMFTSFAMFSIYGAYVSVSYSEYIQGYLGEIARRIAVTPFKKFYLIMTSFTLSVLVGLSFDIIFMLYIKYVLKLNLFSDLAMSMLVFLIASIFAAAFGTVIGLIRFMNSNQKIGLLTGIILLFSFASGLTANTSLKIFFEKNLPLFNRLNPVNLVNECLYRINLIGNNTGVVTNLLTLLVMAAILLTISALVLRRTSYDSL